TVTHPDVTRYFMTIPEAVQLILQASLLEEIRGHVAMLEMGEPLKILDLAENLLRLSGIQDPERIVFTGLRPGEKLHEELVAPEEETVATAIPKVRLVKHGVMAADSILLELSSWETAIAEGRETDLVADLDRLFPERAVAGDGVRAGYATNGRRNGRPKAATAPREPIKPAIPEPSVDTLPPSGIIAAARGSS